MCYTSLTSLPYDQIDLAIIEELGKYGPRNISRIAKRLKISESTVRYKIRKLIEKGLLMLSTNVYHTNIGLKKHVVFASLNPKYHKHIFDLMNSYYFEFLNVVYNKRSYIFGVHLAPPELSDQLSEFLDEMSRLEIIEDYKILYSTCFHNVNLSVAWFDFKNSCWSFSWHNMLDEIEKASTELPFTLKDPKEFPILADELDIYILKELEKDPMIPYIELAEKLNTTPQNIRYHYINHIIRNRLIENFDVAFYRFPPESSLFIIAFLDFTNETYLAKVANAMMNRPFSEVYGKILKQHKLLAYLYLPVSEFGSLVRLFNSMVSAGYLKDYEFFFSPAIELGLRFTIPFMYFKEGKWQFPNIDLIVNNLHAKFHKIAKDN